MGVAQYSQTPAQNGLIAQGIAMLDTPATETAIPMGVRQIMADIATWNATQPVNVKLYGARGDGVTDDSAAIRTAITATGGRGVLYFPAGVYGVSQDGANSWCIDAPASVKMRGDGGTVSVLYPLPGVADTIDIVNFHVSATYENLGGGVSGVGIFYPNDGTRRGRDAIRLDTTVAAGTGVRRFGIDDVFTGSGTATVKGYGFRHINDGAVNFTGGMFDSHIQYSTLDGGIMLDGSGDSIRVFQNTLTGPNVGVTVRLVNHADGAASLCSITENNITSAGGAVRVENGESTLIAHNDIENRTAGAATANDSAVINFARPSAWSGAIAYVVGKTVDSGGVIYRCILAHTNHVPPNATYWVVSDPCAGSIVRDNLVSSFGTADSTIVVRIAAGTNVVVEQNRLLTGLAGQFGIVVTAGAVNAIIGANTFVSSLAEASRIVDSGVGTIGTARQLTLAGAWVPVSASDASPYIAKDIAGIVTLAGCCKDGAAGGGNLLTTLDAPYWPAKNERFGVVCLNGAAYQVGELLISSANGEVRWIGGGSNTRVTLSYSWRAATGSGGSV